ncbi:hypothetical protein [Clostridium estertheticum]|uniref:hypothetical protein n=1 Tax=Clostridium estertheticum TaxID=238834 RepID=UPI0021F42018|nr:hypothetical protein [Clostridium estertheticum]
MKTSVYIYIVPVIAVVSSGVLLHENITGIAILVIILTLAGLFISEGKLIVKLSWIMFDTTTR